MMTVLTGILGSVAAAIIVALLFSLAIFIHEFGHYLAARWFGLQIDVFSIGFGPALWKRQVGGIEYKIGCIPFGGYVALPQLDPSGMERIQGGETTGEDENQEPEERARNLPEIAPWKRIVVSVAGPLGNVALAIALAYFIFLMPGVKTGVVDTTVGTVLEESAAWQAGLRPGDRILAINGKRVATWTDLLVESQLLGEAGWSTFRVARGDATLNMDIAFETDPVSGMRLLADVLPETTCVVVGIRPGSPAERAGLMTNDVIQTAGGTPVLGMAHFISLLSGHGPQPVKLGVLRDGQRLALSATPDYDDALGRFLIGVEVSDGLEDVRAWMMFRNPWQQLKWDSLSVVRVLQALIAPREKGERSAVARHVGGPVAIVIGLYQTVRVGIMDGIGFLRMICINLAILNLLPLPVLDGGHVLFALFEILTRRKPHPRVVAVLVNTCAALLIGLMLLLVYRDIARQFRHSQTTRAFERQMIEQSADPAPDGPAGN